MSNDDELGHMIRLNPGRFDGLISRLEDNWRNGPPYGPLRPLSSIYGAIAAFRRNFYNKLFKAGLAEKPVISLGNLTVGGSGKTPLCLALARLLLNKGLSPAILSRGYGRKTSASFSLPLIVSDGQGPEVPPLESGDEPWLMASQLPEAKVVVDADRLRAAKAAVDLLGADILLLDDGFQQLKLHADCRILLVPAHNPFGNGAVLPAGPLRERLEANRLAHILVSTGAERPSAEAAELAGDRPVFAAEYHSLGWQQLGRDSLLPLTALEGSRVMAFCGLGRPDNFKKSLTRAGVDLCRFVALKDHQVYHGSLLERLKLEYQASGAELLVTTAKDAVKLPPDFPLPVMILQIEMRLNQPDEFLEAVLRQACHRFENLQ